MSSPIVFIVEAGSHDCERCPQECVRHDIYVIIREAFNNEHFDGIHPEEVHAGA
jgi:hypothetical protein